jgi:hypothetical protein
MLSIFKKKKKHLPDFAAKLNDQLKKINAKYPYINHGGCCYFATALKDHLNKLGIEAKFYLISNTNISDVINARSDNRLSSLNTSGVYLAHMMCKVENILIDSTGVHESINKTEWHNHKGQIVERENVIKSWLEEYGVWNPTFDRTNLPLIYEDIKQITI